MPTNPLYFLTFLQMCLSIIEERREGALLFAFVYNETCVPRSRAFAREPRKYETEGKSARSLQNSGRLRKICDRKQSK